MFFVIFALVYLLSTVLQYTIVFGLNQAHVAIQLQFLVTSFAISGLFVFLLHPLSIWALKWWLLKPQRRNRKLICNEWLANFLC